MFRPTSVIGPISWVGNFMAVDAPMRAASRSGHCHARCSFHRTPFHLRRTTYGRRSRTEAAPSRRALGTRSYLIRHIREGGLAWGRTFQRYVWKLSNSRSNGVSTQSVSSETVPSTRRNIYDTPDSDEKGKGSSLHDIGEHRLHTFEDLRRTVPIGRALRRLQRPAYVWRRPGERHGWGSHRYNHAPMPP